MLLANGNRHWRGAKDIGGWCFNLKDSTSGRWITLTYRTEPEAKAAREKIQAATTGVIEAFIG